MPEADLEQRIADVRRFNRFYTRHVGALNEGLLKSSFSLTEMRVLYELANQDRPTAAKLAREMGLDRGYLSRILKNFRERGLLETEASRTDGRQTLLSLTEQGRKAFARYNKASHDEVAAVLEQLSEPEQARLLDALHTVETILGDRRANAEPYLIRPHRPGDIGWMVHRHAAIYVDGYGFDPLFEGEVAEIAGKFLQGFDPEHERCWIAERDGEIVGSVFVRRKAEGVAKLHMLYVEPEARGLGIGSRLVDECIRFARQAGYKKMALWTIHILASARRIYEAAGFRKVKEEHDVSFGKDLTGQFWELDL